MTLKAMEIFKYLPGGKRDSNANCKKCSCATCMMFAIKLSKGDTDCSLCPFVSEELKEKLEHSKKIQQKVYEVGNLKIGGETVLYRHEKTFINPTALVFSVDCKDEHWQKKLQKLIDFEFECIGVKYRVDGVYLKNACPLAKQMLLDSEITLVEDDLLNKFQKVQYTNTSNCIDTLTTIRTNAVVNRDQNYCEPVYVELFGDNFLKLCSIASSLICKYANVIIFDQFSEAMLASLITLRTNIFTDPQKPLQVESKVYEFNNPDENALVFLTTNFALSYFAVANELSSLKCGSYLVITPSEGMSVLTAWSAQKITADIASKIVGASDILDKVKDKKLIIPGLLSDLKDELQESLPDWQIVVGTTEAYKIPEFVKKLKSA